jgi:hypothetical protein
MWWCETCGRDTPDGVSQCEACDVWWKENTPCGSQAGPLQKRVTLADGSTVMLPADATLAEPWKEGDVLDADAIKLSGTFE